jgi:adenylosuccinate lyase
MRRFNIPNAYELLKDATKGKAFSAQDYREFVQGLELPEGAEEARTRLLELTPATYVGLSRHLAESLVEDHMPGASFPDALDEDDGGEAESEEGEDKV